MVDRATTSPACPSPGLHSCASEPGFGSGPTQTTRAILDSSSGGIAPTITANNAGPGSSDTSYGDKNIPTKGVNIMQSGEDNKMTP